MLSFVYKDKKNLHKSLYFKIFSSYLVITEESHMKSTGIVRPIDTLGRFVLPKEIRDTMELQTKDPLEIFVEGEKIILKKYQPSCIFCANADEVTYFKGKLICRDCLKALSYMGNL